MTCLSEPLVSGNPFRPEHHHRTSPVRCVRDETAHRVYDYRSCTTVDAPAERKEVTLGPGATQIVPKPARWSEPTIVVSIQR